VDEETQKEINKSCKDEIKYQLKYEQLEKENPNLTPPEIDEIIEKQLKTKKIEKRRQ